MEPRDLIDADAEKRAKAERAMDAIRDRYGADGLALGLTFTGEAAAGKTFRVTCSRGGSAARSFQRAGERIVAVVHDEVVGDAVLVKREAHLIGGQFLAKALLRRLRPDRNRRRRPASSATPFLSGASLASGIALPIAAAASSDSSPVPAPRRCRRRGISGWRAPRR